MKLLMHVLKSNPRLKIYNPSLDLMTILEKLDEEYEEVKVAILNYLTDKSLSNLKEIVRETFDVIQVCILLLYRCSIKADDLDEKDLICKINIEHKDKLIDRGWIPQTGIEIDIKE